MWRGLEGIGWGWIGLGIPHMVWFGVLTFVCLGILIWLIGKPAQTNAIEMLNMRYATGELTREQIERMKRELACAGDGS